MIKYLPILLFLFSCNGNYKCYSNLYQNITSYEVKPNVTTNSGIRVDTGGFQVDLVSLDDRISKIEQCIQNVSYHIGGKITKEQQAQWMCLRDKFDISDTLKRDCLIIKVVEPTLSKCSAWQHIPIKAPDSYCISKGLTPTPECPCLWRTAIQNENVIITPPAMYLWEIGRMFTSCNNIWVTPFAQCLNY